MTTIIFLVFTSNLYSFENKFGGFWRTRAFSNINFSGTDDETQDISSVDTRTRLYYTAIFSDNFKFVNKFEFNAMWGDDGYGDIGTDGKGVFKIKHSYADITHNHLNIKVGAHSTTIGRGFIFDDDFMGLTLTYKCEKYKIPFIWIKATDKGSGKDENDSDRDIYVLSPSFRDRKSVV